MKSILIIGGGVSGLSAGIFALLNGYNVTICEKHSILGGNLTGWNRNGYHIDNCIHWLTGTNSKSNDYLLWKKLNAFYDKDIIHLDSFYTVFDEKGNKISLYQDLYKTEREMINLSLEDKDEIISFIQGVREIKMLLGFGGADNNLSANIFKKSKSVLRLLKYYQLSLGELAKRFKHPLLKRVITGFIEKPYSSLGLMFAYATFSGKNGGLIKGGSLKMAINLTERFKSLGGVVYTKSAVEKVDIDNGEIKSITLADGRILSSNYYIFATDIETTYYKLLNLPMPKTLKERLNSKQMIRFSSIHTAISCEGVDLPFYNEAVIPVGEKYKNVIGLENLVIREFSYQQNFSPSGKTILQTMTLCNELTAREWIALKDDQEKYLQKKQEFASAVKDCIEEFFPTLSGKIQVIDCWTPLTYNRYLGEKNGSYMSYILPPKTIPSVCSNKIKGVKNGIICSQWLQSIGGLPISLNSGHRGIETIKKLDKVKEKTPLLLKIKKQQKSS